MTDILKKAAEGITSEASTNGSKQEEDMTLGDNVDQHNHFESEFFLSHSTSNVMHA